MNDIMIDWKKYFDKIIVLHYAKNLNIEDRLNAELNRVGILQSGICYIYENINSPLFDVLRNNMKCDVEHLKNASTMSCAWGHYSILKIAAIKGYKTTLILEDDIAFHKDIDVIENILE